MLSSGNLDLCLLKGSSAAFSSVKMECSVNDSNKRHRKPNWTEKEVLKMLEEISFEKTLLMSAFQNNITRAKKTLAWEQITERINAVGGNGREVEDVKKKWKDMKKAPIDRPNVMSKTGGGGKVPEVPFEELIMEIVGADTHLRSGIPDSQLSDTWGEPLGLDETQSQFDAVVNVEDTYQYPDGASVQPLSFVQVPFSQNSGRNINLIEVDEAEAIYPSTPGL